MEENSIISSEVVIDLQGMLIPASSIKLVKKEYDNAKTFITTIFIYFKDGSNRNLIYNKNEQNLAKNDYNTIKNIITNYLMLDRK